ESKQVTIDHAVVDIDNNGRDDFVVAWMNYLYGAAVREQIVVKFDDEAAFKAWAAGGGHMEALHQSATAAPKPITLSVRAAEGEIDGNQGFAVLKIDGKTYLFFGQDRDAQWRSRYAALVTLEPATTLDLKCVFQVSGDV